VSTNGHGLCHKMKKQCNQPRTVLRVEVSPKFKKELETFCEFYGEKYSTVSRIALREFMKKHAAKESSDEETLASESSSFDLNKLKEIIQNLEDGKN